MFTFRRVTLLFFLILMCMNIWNLFIRSSDAGFFYNHASQIYIVLIISYFTVCVAMAFLPCSNFHHPVICKGASVEKNVAITFDDGPDPVKTLVVADILKKHEVKATFFCIGNRLAGNEAIIRQLFADGHLIGNHSFSHAPWFDLFTARRMKAELLKTDTLIKDLTGRSPLFFRPPFGVVNPMVSNALRNMHWQAVCWNIRSMDTLNRNPEAIMKKILRSLKPGSVILLHDYTSFSCQQLENLISAIRKAGFSIVPLDKLLNLPAYAS
jgi:peptidoglycan/xylan/chitin deacetylase (PgdA/CDA1 family)